MEVFEAALASLLSDVAVADLTILPLAGLDVWADDAAELVSSD